VPIQRLTAGDDVDVVVNDSKEGNDLSNIGGLTISLFNPPSGTAFDSQLYFTHFRPDAPDTGLENIRRAFGIATTDIDSTYNFDEVRSGDDIDIGHISTTAPFGEPRPYALTQITLTDGNNDHVLESL
jgi:hypothetical protein